MNQYAVSVWVNGTPKGQPRPRAVTFYSQRKQKYMSRVHDAGTAENWKAQVQLALYNQLPEEPLLGPFAVVIDLVLPRPKRLMRKKDYDGQIYHDKKPDVDNAAKAILDAINNMGIWHDDSQVAQLLVRKHYAAKNARPGAAIDIVQLQPQEVAECEAIEAAR